MKFKLIGLVVALIVVAGLVAVAAHATNAYFTGTQYGAQTGTIGNIAVTMSGGSGDPNNSGSPMVFNWSDMLPGVVYSSAISVQNTSSDSNAEDIYMTFPNATALSALNTLGEYGAVEILWDGNLVYENNNLNDIPNNGTSGLPNQIELKGGVSKDGVVHTVTFKFEYASALYKSEPNGVFNAWPITLAMSGGVQDSRYLPGFGQVTVKSSDGSGSGLPFNIVATQPGVQPGADGSKFQDGSPF